MSIGVITYDDIVLSKINEILHRENLVHRLLNKNQVLTSKSKSQCVLFSLFLLVRQRLITSM